jgi:hypothetical protein
MDISTIFIITACLIASSVLLLTGGYLEKDNTKNVYNDNYLYKNVHNDDKYMPYSQSYSSKLLRRNDFPINKGYPGPNTRCFSCEKQMPQGKEYLSRPTKCFSCEQQAGSFGNPTKCFSCGQ